MTTFHRRAIIAALPREIAGLVRGMRPDPQFASRLIHLYRMPNAVVIAAGMGPVRATLAFQAALEEGPFAEIISTGLAGSCRPEVEAGSVLEAGMVVDARTGERFRGQDGDAAILATTVAIAGVTEKARLAATYQASAVDMEAATIARLAGAHGLTFRAIKAISDAHDFEITELARFAGPQGQFRTAAFALHTAVRPASWPGAIKLGQNSQRALAALHANLSEVLGSF